MTELTLTLPTGGTKNTTRLSSLLGTWTSQTHMKADIGRYEALAYFIVHFMPDPTRGYGCALAGCNEVENKVCTATEEGSDLKKKCVDVNDAIVNWSDIVSFIYFGAKIDAGIPFNVHKHHDTGGWVGPFSIVMAQNASAVGKSDGKNVVVDQYLTRYVRSYSTSLLEMPPDCNLVRPSDFEKYMGPTAVNSTTAAQYSNGTNADDYDPYGKYLNTCDNGDVKPILPLYDFKFVQEKLTKKESLEVKLDYKLLTIPKKTDIMYKVFPRLQKRVNRRKGEFHISGPYCYGNDPKRGYTFDFNYDSRHENAFVKLEHGCVKGLPCVPPAAELTPVGASYEKIIHDKLPNSAATIRVGGVLYLTLMLVVLGVVLIVSLVYNRRFSRQLRQARMQLRELGSHRGDSDDEAGRRDGLEMEVGGFGDGATTKDDGGKHELAEPLLSNRNRDGVERRRSVTDADEGALA